MRVPFFTKAFLLLTLIGVLNTQPAGAQTRTGYILVDAKNGEVLTEHHSERQFIPASTLKLITALAALDRLGPGHRLETTISTSGKLTDGLLTGDVVLRGGGNVALDLDDLMEMALALRARGIRRVEGRFLVSDVGFLRLSEINPTQPLDAPYNAGIGALSLAFGRVDMQRGGDGFYTNPPLQERGPAWSIAEGLMPQSVRALPVRDVGMHAARNLQRLAKGIGVELPVPTRGTSQAQPREVLTVMSKPIGELVEDMLTYSNNQLAESLGLVTSRSLGVKAETLAESAAALTTDLLTRLDDVGWDNLVVTNHSGLDSGARASPAQLATILAYGLEEHALPSMLPANGWWGSLQRRMVEPEMLQRIWAKTGSIDFAVSLAGFLLSDTSGLLIFVLMSDDLERRAAYDAMEVPSPAIRRDAARWDDMIKAEHDALLRQWLVGRF